MDTSFASAFKIFFRLLSFIAGVFARGFLPGVFAGVFAGVIETFNCLLQQHNPNKYQPILLCPIQLFISITTHNVKNDTAGTTTAVLAKAT